MSNKLETSIKAFTEKDQFSHGKYNFPALFTVFGTPKSGKSYYVFNLLKEIKDNFDRIIIYLGTKDAAAGFLGLADKDAKKKPQINVLFKYDANDLYAYFKKLETEQLQLIEANKKPKRVLLVFDDILGLHGFMTTNRAKPSPIHEISANYRHLGLSVIITSQSYMDVIKPIRALNFKYCIITSVGMKDLKLIGEEHENLYFSGKDIIEIFKNIRSHGIGNCMLISNDDDDLNRFWWIHKDGQITNIKPL
jgi:Poxvirus A32 protein